MRMNDRVEIAREPAVNVAIDFDAIVIGAGVLPALRRGFGGAISPVDGAGVRT